MTNPDASALKRSVKPLYFAAGSSGLLLYVCFFPLNLGFVAWFALVPLLFLVHSDARPRHVYLAAFVGGLFFYLPAIQWMRVAHPAMYGTWFALSVYSALYFPLSLWLIRRCNRAHIPLLLVIPSIWTGFEYMRMHFPTGFPWLESTGFLHRIGFGWYFLGYSQHEFLPVIQIADLTGVYGVSFLIVLVNTLIYRWARCSACCGQTPLSRPLLETVVTTGLLAATVIYGYRQLDHPALPAGPRVALLQSNVAQSVKMNRDGESQLDKHMTSLLREAVTTTPDEIPDLIVWPETTFSKEWFGADPGSDSAQTPKSWREAMSVSSKNAQIIAGWASGKSSQLLGLNCLEREADGQIWKYNSAILVGRDGKAGPRYDKMHLVPFGEYVPLRNTFPWMKSFSPYTHDYSCKPGEHWTRFPLTVKDKTYHFGCLICYEDSDPSLARNYAIASPVGPSVDFLVNISNDGWFDGTEEHEQHLAICRFRAIECRRSIVRAVNMGISGFIDSDGRIVKIPGSNWHDSKKISAVVKDVVPIDDRGTVYSHWGDWLPLTCWGIMLAGFINGFRRRNEAV